MTKITVFEYVGSYGGGFVFINRARDKPLPRGDYNHYTFLTQHKDYKKVYEELGEFDLPDAFLRAIGFKEDTIEVDAAYIE